MDDFVIDGIFNWTRRGKETRVASDAAKQGRLPAVFVWGSRDLQFRAPVHTLVADMSDVAIDSVTRPFAAEIAPPGSKSMTNRALILAALAAGKSTLTNVLIADDTRVMVEALKELGFELENGKPGKTLAIAGRSGAIPVAAAKLFCGNSGTTIRFLTALLAPGPGGIYPRRGGAAMRERPIGDLADMLRHLGVRTRSLERAGFPPILVHADELPGGILRAGAAQSSQFLSAVLMVSPYARHEVTVDLIERQTSWPYVSMTMRMMDMFGVTPELIRDAVTQEPKRIVVPRGMYDGGGVLRSSRMRRTRRISLRPRRSIPDRR